jgi:hypothetical protein
VKVLRVVGFSEVFTDDYIDIDRYKLEGECIGAGPTRYVALMAWVIDGILCIGIGLYVVSSIVSTMPCYSTIFCALRTHLMQDCSRFITLSYVVLYGLGTLLHCRNTR